MTSPLATLRKAPQLTPSQFLATQPGSWIQYYDDTAAKDRAKALSARQFDPVTARRKQEDKCAVCFSLQPFAVSRTERQLLCVRNLGVDIDLIPRAERAGLSPEEIDRRKDDYLSRYLLPFPLKPHWLVETKHGFHAIFRIQGQRTQDGIRDGITLNRRLVRVLQGDENAVLLTQVLRVPGTLQFKVPEHPFLCRLLIDNASTIAPYTLNAVRGVLDAWEVFHETKSDAKAEQATQSSGNATQPSRWREGLNGVSEGQRNATAASVIGSILARLPEELWETAGWGGLKEWNGRNTALLPERELRSVFESIARRERGKRQGGQRWVSREAPMRILVQVDVRIEGGGTEQPGASQTVPAPVTPRTDASSSQPRYCDQAATAQTSVVGQPSPSPAC